VTAACNDDDDSDDRTLVDDVDERCDSVVTHTDDALHFTEDEDLLTHTRDDKNILVTLSAIA
jgi:hypothetical protein